MYSANVRRYYIVIIDLKKFSVPLIKLPQHITYVLINFPVPILKHTYYPLHTNHILLHQVN